MICGVDDPARGALVGHSDADVGLHALTDAVLGAIGAGDIGMHFPPSDPRWRGAASRPVSAPCRRPGARARRRDRRRRCDDHLRAAKNRVRIATAMVERVAAILGISPDRVSVKATTTERLGFTGRGEGIAAQAVATVRLPL